MRNRKFCLLVILVIAFALRAAAAVGVQGWLDRPPSRNFLIEGDANGYWDLALALSRGDDFALYEPPRRVMRMPGFSAFLALSIKLSGGGYLVARLTLAAAGTAACGLVYWLGRELVDANVGIVAAALTSFSPIMVGFSAVLLSETLFATCLVASLVGLQKVVSNNTLSDEFSKKSAAWALLAGILIALACYVRPSWLLVAPLFAIVLVCLTRNRKSAVYAAMCVLAGLAIALAPWIARNYLVTGHFVVTTLWVGPSLYDGLHPRATGDSDMSFVEEDALMGPPTNHSEYEMNQIYTKKAWDFVKGNPGRTLQLAGHKLVRYWKPWPNAKQFQGFWKQAAVAIWFVPIILLAAVGMWSQVRQPWSLLLTVGPIIYFALIHSIFVGSLRYRLPAEYPLCVMSAVGIHVLWQWGRAKLGVKELVQP